jgi:hypothetical protein
VDLALTTIIETGRDQDRKHQNGARSIFTRL